MASIKRLLSGCLHRIFRFFGVCQETEQDLLQAIVVQEDLDHVTVCLDVPRAAAAAFGNVKAGAHMGPRVATSTATWEVPIRQATLSEDSIRCPTPVSPPLSESSSACLIRPLSPVMMSPSPTNSDAEDVMFEDMPLLNKDSSGSSGIDVNTDEDMF